MLIDVHAHIGRLGTERSEALDVNDLVNKMDAWGIDKSCVHCLSEHPEAHYLESDTEDVIAACSKYPDRLLPFCLIDPRFGLNSPGHGLQLPAGGIRGARLQGHGGDAAQDVLR